ncbi:MAG: M61 family metallopeptidase [Herpetosiphonaceae bacterium]|nr:M61 family metallopeptidase [Herpetosiphonaceae bacterium]
MIRYKLSLAARVQHLVDVDIHLTDLSTDAVDLVMPAWTPGSYLLREYARHVQNFRAEAHGQPVSWSKVEKGRWRIAVQGRSLSVHYQVYANELSVRTSHADATHAHLMPAATCMYLEGAKDERVQIDVEPPVGWTVATGLPCLSAGEPWPGPGAATFMAESYDQLVDSPFEIGTHRTLAFAVDGRPHRIVVWGRGNEDDQRLVADTQRIVEAERDFWGGLPYDDYTFFLLLGGKTASGGLEHRNSTSLFVPRFIFRPAKNYERYLSLVSHEFFHTWNVKRLRAAGLGPFDYTQETYTPLLWAMEGVTEYYTDLLLCRAGLFSSQRYLERLADDILMQQATPGRQLQSLSCSSFDSWIKFYRPDENTVNTGISYYLKGALVALVLDLDIRQRTNNVHSLDHVMSYLYEQYPLGGPGMPPDAYQQAIQQVAGIDASDFFDRYINGTDEVPFSEYLAAAGIVLEWSFKDRQHDGDEPRPTLGIRIRSDNGQFKVANVLSDGPAARSGLAAEDELIALDDFRIADEGTLYERLRDRQPGETVTMTVFRREMLMRIAVTLGTPQHDGLKLVLRPDVTEAQRALRADWLRQHDTG